MKTRIIKTKYWSDSTIHALPKEARYLFIYLLTSTYINLCGIFELPDEYIQLDTGLTDKELQRGKQELSKKNKVRFYNGWVYIVKSDKHNGYRNSPTTEIAYKRELEGIPTDIRGYLDASISDSSIDTSSDSTMHSTPNPKTINNNKEIRNKKSELINKNKELLDELKIKFPNKDVDEEVDKMIDFLSSTGKQYKDYEAFARNWLRRAKETKAGKVVSFR